MKTAKLEQTAVNDSGTGSDPDTPLTRARSGPVRFELIDKDGKPVASYTKVRELGEYASVIFPRELQDPDRMGVGWDIAVVGAEK